MHPILIALLLSNTCTVDSFTLNHRRSKRTLSLAHIHGRKDKEVEELLIPLDNPTIDPITKSISGVTYGSVLAGLDNIYPPNELSKRNAISRTDGYWSFIEAGEKPPQHFTYGEFDFLFFAELLDNSFDHYKSYDHDDNTSTGKNHCTGTTFLDIGSGAGRLVMGAAALHPTLKESRGLEILPGIHEASLKNLERCKLSSNQELADGEITEVEEVAEDEEEYGEPLCRDMNEMQKALQGMTAEEWKAILGDLELDEDLFDDNASKDDENDGDNNDTCTTDEDGETYSHDDANVEHILDDEEEESSKTAIEQERTQEHRITPNFILSPDDRIVHNVENEHHDKKGQYFASFDEFMECTQLEWNEILVNYTEGNDPNPTDSTALTESENSTNVANLQEEFILSYSNEGSTEELPLAPIRFSCGSFQDPYEYIGDANIIFVFSSCMTIGMMSDLSDCLGRCRPGTIIITTDFMLEKTGYISPLENDPEMPYGDYEIELLESVAGFNWVMDNSTAFIQRVTNSVWDGSGPREKPRLKPEEEAFQVIRDMEGGNLTDTDKFLRRVRNNMVFNGVSDIILTIEEDDTESDSSTNDGLVPLK